jgi:hypothetical protein
MTSCERIWNNFGPSPVSSSGLALDDLPHGGDGEEWRGEKR